MRAAVAADLAFVREAAASLAGNAEEEDLDDAIDLVVQALDSGVYSPPIPDDRALQ